MLDTSDVLRARIDSLEEQHRKDLYMLLDLNREKVERLARLEVRCDRLEKEAKDRKTGDM